MDLLDYFSLDFDSIILDPWNGSGTTTEISSGLGYDSVGFDLNPVMLIVARARNVTYQQYDELYEMNRSLHNKLKNLDRFLAEDRSEERRVGKEGRCGIVRYKLTENEIQ